MLKFLRGNLTFEKRVCKHFMHSSSVFTQDRPTPAADETASFIPYRGDYSQKAADARRQWVENVTKTSLSNLDGWWAPNAQFDEEHLIGNTENAIGVIRIPVGIVGPIDIHGKYASGTFLVPASTLEGALVASACRGAALLRKAGGVEAHAYRQRMVRAPTFCCESAEEAERLEGWIQNSLPILHEVVASVSKRARLKALDFVIDEGRLTTFFAYDSAEAAGQNMSTTCTKACCDWIVDNVQELDIKITHFFEETGLAGDKQVSSLNALFGRGVSVVARASIPDTLIESMFKVKADEVVRGFALARDHLHRAMSPSVQIGNVPNMVAAMFAAFGQDLGSVGECSQAFFNVQKGHDLGYVDVELKMPSLSIGTVGGGTALPTQSQCLAMVGCQGGPNSNRKLAEIIASVCLGAELSLLVSVVANKHSDSHDRFGRNRPI
ncbi:uncharacterized protein [Amphiura filiformis]|uniref:uncharacterized protein n=1 Tax=Amphiura filiformis TaxID=82378 RepID=UPI003B221004